MPPDLITGPGWGVLTVGPSGLTYSFVSMVHMGDHTITNYTVVSWGYTLTGPQTSTRLSLSFHGLPTHPCYDETHHTYESGAKQEDES